MVIKNSWIFHPKNLWYLVLETKQNDKNGKSSMQVPV